MHLNNAFGGGMTLVPGMPRTAKAREHLQAGNDVGLVEVAQVALQRLRQAAVRAPGQRAPLLRQGRGGWAQQ